MTTKLSSGAQSLAPVLETGRKLGFTVEPINIDDPANLAKALGPEVLSRFDALVFVPDALISAHMAEVIKLVGATTNLRSFPRPNGSLMAALCRSGRISPTLTVT